MTDALQHRIEGMRDDLIALTQDLIRIPTLNPPGENYAAICDLLKQRLAAKGFETTLIRAEGAPGDCEKYPRWNIVARYEGAKPGPCVHFNGHTDVVPVADQDWSCDPFAMTIRDDRLYGRGSCDMKGFIAAAVTMAPERTPETAPDILRDLRARIHGTLDWVLAEYLYELHPLIWAQAAMASETGAPLPVRKTLMRRGLTMARLAIARHFAPEIMDGTTIAFSPHGLRFYTTP